MSYISKYFTANEVKCKCPDDCGRLPGNKILAIADTIREGWAKEFPENPGIRCTSGARCENYTKYLQLHGIPAATRSAHIEGLALDLKPINGEMKRFQDYVRSRLAELEIRMEDPAATPSWTHIDLRPVAAGKPRVFKP